MKYEIIFIILVKGIKRKMIRKIVNNSRTRRKFEIIRIKRRKYFVKPIIHINDRIFESFSLTWSK